MTCDCHMPPRPATHRGRTGRLLCAETADRATRNAEWVAARIRPTPLDPTMFELRRPPGGVVACACETAESREAAMVTVRRTVDGTVTVWCDACIAPIVAALNDGGVPTVASCCGHGQEPGVISLADGRNLWIGADTRDATGATIIWGPSGEPANCSSNTNQRSTS